MDGTTREFTLDELGVKLVLRKGADDLTQYDFDQFYAAFGRMSQGGYIIEDNGKKVRAAFEAKWIESLVLPEPVANALEVASIKPQWKVRWVAEQINAVIDKAHEIPKP